MAHPFAPIVGGEAIFGAPGRVSQLIGLLRRVPAHAGGFRDRVARGEDIVGRGVRLTVAVIRAALEEWASEGT